MFEPLTDGARHPNGWRCTMVVSSQYEARQFGDTWATTHLLSMRGGSSRLLSMTGIPDDRHLTLVFDDTADSAHPGAPPAEHVETVSRWIDALPSDARLLVHCLQGISRSTAVALGVLARYRDPEQAGQALHALRPMAIPNALIVRQWDAAYALDGTLTAIAGRFPCRVWTTGDHASA